MAPKTWDNDDEERRPDPHDSALSVGTNNNLDETAKMRELEVELHNMTDKVASACKSTLLLTQTPHQCTRY